MSKRAQLFVGRLPRRIHEKHLENIFDRYGKLLRCDVKYGSGLAYAFIDYEDKRDADDAIKYESGREIEGQCIVVEWARGPAYRPSVYDECFHCHRTGHWARDCRNADRGNRRRGDRQYPSYNNSRSPSSSNRFGSRSQTTRRARSRSRDTRKSSRRRSRSSSRSFSRSLSQSKRKSQSLSKSRSGSRERSRRSRQSNRSCSPPYEGERRSSSKRKASPSGSEESTSKRKDDRYDKPEGKSRSRDKSVSDDDRKGSISDKKSSCKVRSSYRQSHSNSTNNKDRSKSR